MGAPQWLQDMNAKQRRLFTKAAMANSPTWWLPIAVLLLCSIFSWSIKSWWDVLQSNLKALNHAGVGCGQ